MCHLWQTPTKKTTKVGQVSSTELVAHAQAAHFRNNIDGRMSQAQAVQHHKDTDGKLATSARYTIRQKH